MFDLQNLAFYIKEIPTSNFVQKIYILTYRLKKWDSEKIIEIKEGLIAMSNRLNSGCINGDGGGEYCGWYIDTFKE